MGSSYMSSGGDNYLAHFPKFQRWINQCAACGHKGYKPEMPEHIGKNTYNVGADRLRQFFQPLQLDADGLCDQCASGKEKSKKSGHDT
jgi:hypothetical protein